MSISFVIRSLIFPTVLLGSIYVFYRLLSAGIEPALALLGLSIVNLIVVALLEVAFPLREEWIWLKDRQVINDLFHGLLLSTIGPRLGEIVLFTVIATGAASIAEMSEGGLWPSDLSLWVQLVLAVVVFDFVEWGKHWLYHHWGPAWAIHALHHNPDRMHVMKGARLHFLEATIRYTLVTAPLLVLGAGPEVIFWYAALMNFLGNLNHSNIDMPLPGFLHYLFATPQIHHIHHAKDLDLGRSNLSAFTMLPDLLFGTHRHPKKHPLKEIGIEEDPIPGNLFAQLAAPFIWPLLVWRYRRKVKRTAQVPLAPKEV